MSRWLGELGAWAISRSIFSTPPSELTDSLARPLKKLKEDLWPDSSVVEHMSDIMHLSGYDAAYDFALDCAPAMVSSLPDCARSMFAGEVEESCSASLESIPMGTKMVAE